MRFFRLFLVICLISAFFINDSHAQDTLPRYESIRCPSDLELPDNVECGRLTLLEDRNDANSRTIELPIYISRARFGAATEPPIVYLSGGPGSEISASAKFINETFGAFNINRDLILFDQRGTGRADPSLKCPEYSLAVYEAYALPFSLEEGATHAADALLGCYNNFVAEGVDINAYTSADSAADLDDLRQALGIEQWSLYGISYGTRLALTAMRDFPDGIYSVVIDGVSPPQSDLYGDTPANGAAAIDGLFALCAADRDCNETYPDLERVFYEVVDRLNANPIEMKVQRQSDEEYYDATLDGSLFVGAIFWNLYSSFAISFLPYVIYATYAGEYEIVEDFLLPSYFIWDNIATVMHYAVNCNEKLAFNSFADMETASDGLDPRLQEFFDMDNYITWEICDEWQTDEPDSIENEPVISDIPTLLLSGELDPITPPRNAELAAATLSNSFHFIVPGGGHGVSRAYECAADIMRRFLADPTTEPEASCLYELGEVQFNIIPVTVS